MRRIQRCSEARPVEQERDIAMPPGLRGGIEHHPILPHGGMENHADQKPTGQSRCGKHDNDEPK